MMMEEKKSPYKVHCFVCTKCEHGQRLRDELKQLAKDQMPDAPIRINASGCLGMCEHPIATVLYPSGTFILNTGENMADSLLQRIKNQLTQTLD